MYRAQDDPVLGAPHALCAANDPLRLLAPFSCTLVAGAVPPQYSFHRHHYHWLALSLARCDASDCPDHPLESVVYGEHTLRWDTMYEIVSRAMAAGFSVPAPTDITFAVQSALIWGPGHRDSLRRIGPEDFEALPAMAPAAGGSWWLTTSYASWVVDCALHSLVQAIGYAGPIWDTASRGADSRFCLSLLLTQEFQIVSASMPQQLYGGPAIQFYMSTMLPAQLLYFPTNAARLHNALTVRWGYHHGTPVQIQITLAAVLPLVIRECLNLSRFLNPSTSVTAQVAAYRSISSMLCPACEGHKHDTIRLVDRRLEQYLRVADAADQLVPPAMAEARALLLKSALDAESLAVTSAPVLDRQSPGGEPEGPATQSIVTALFELRRMPAIVTLEDQLKGVWTPETQHPAAVFMYTLASRSVTCIAILFGNLTGVRQSGLVFSILEEAAAERLKYFTLRLAIPEGETRRPDHTLWYNYPLKLDNLVRSPHLEVFSKINLLDLGSKIRQLRAKVASRPQDSVRPGQEFAADSYMYHFSLLNHISPWLEALGFQLGGSAGFDAVLKALSNFCQDGSHYQGALMDIHVQNMRSLYRGIIEDLHIGFQPFWNRRPASYFLMMAPDQLFTQTGVFYGTLRRCMVDIEKGNDYLRFGAIPAQAGLPINRKRQRAAYWAIAGPSAASGGATSAAPPSSSPAQPREPPPVGAWAWSVREDPNFIQIFEYKYAKAPILEKLGLNETEICLPAYLSRKGAAACTHAGAPGHENLASTLHVFSSAALILRPTFDNEPFRTLAEGNSGGQEGTGKGRGARWGKGRWRSSRFGAAGPGRK